MFEAKTYEAVLADILSRAPDGIDLRQGSIFCDAVAGIAFKIAKYYADLEQVFNLVFLPTATGDYLTMRAEEHGVYRQPPSPAKYKAEFTGTIPEPGTRFFADGHYFLLMQDDELGLYLEAETPGSAASDLPPGTPIVPVDTINGLTAASISEEIEPAPMKRETKASAPECKRKSPDRLKTGISSITKRGARRSRALAGRVSFHYGTGQTPSRAYSSTRTEPRPQARSWKECRNTSTPVAQGSERA